MNTTFGTLKTNALRRAGNRYNSSDATLLSLAGNIINDILSLIGQQIRGHPYTLDIGNTVATVADQEYVDTVDTDIVEILQFKQTSTNTKLKQITYEQYVSMFPNTALVGGVPELVWAPTAVIAAGVLTWRVYLGWTPSSVITMTYDYVKNLRFSADGPSQDASFCPLSPVYDRWIYAEFAPMLYEILSPSDTNRIQKAENKALQVRTECLNELKNGITRSLQMGRFGEDIPHVWKPVATTPAP